LIGGPRGHPARAGRRQPHGGGRVRADQLVGDGFGEGGAEHGARVEHRPPRELLLAAAATSAAPLLARCANRVFALQAALAPGGEAVQPAANVGDGERVEPLLPQVRDDVAGDDTGVGLGGLRHGERRDHLAQPPGQVVGQAW
jgi:hypothetical protein